MKVDITVHVHAAASDHIQQQLGNVLSILRGLMNMNIDQVLADLTARVKAQDTKLDSLRTYNDGLRQAVIDAVNAAQKMTPEQEAAAQAVFDGLAKNDAEIDQAMTANTPDGAPVVKPI